ncbi:hypothetical protein BU25DRAFT_464110 [Macroventuria anomochaeta]|uniref:Uncharacterized protein n=1 Tax=Macroventuria anomochaeta TaxID=301207 RepID=A0ACB6SGW5_9PLEO|nr:uncharacterized protein BU25DRAFT_464110 [Macroventuria anomochaeta]KAF2633197.1 hypothetical protein BU25DRAFT_464110 [Macroventuria anomochaeta]
MEPYVLSPRVRTAPWKVKADVATYIYLAELFAFIGMPDASRHLEEAIFRRFQESPLQVEQIRAIRGRDNHVQPSRYAEAMTDKIVTLMCVPKLHLFATKHHIEPKETYEEVVKKTTKRMKATFPEKEGFVSRQTSVKHSIDQDCRRNNLRV